MMRVAIRSGGQTGVDRAALDVAIQLGLDYGGWCPRGGWAEDSPVPPGVLARYPRLTETPSTDPEQRTAWNVRDSHATLILVPGDELARCPGTIFTRQCAELLFVRPCLVANLAHVAAAGRVHDWLARLAAGLGINDPWLNVAGPRASESPGIYVDARKFLVELLS
jgi:hypothetical protein